MTTRTGALIATFCLFAIGVETSIYRATHPVYRTTVFENETVSLEYPATWRAPRYSVNKVSKFVAVGEGGKLVPGFNTRWDHFYNLDFYIDFERPEYFQGKDGREALINGYQERHKRPFGKALQAPQNLKPTKVAGFDAWEEIRPHEYEMLDIIMPPHFSFHPLKMTYNLFFGGEDMDHVILFRTKSGWCRITYFVPGDKIARARYERVWGRVLDSLKIKDA